MMHDFGFLKRDRLANWALLHDYQMELINYVH